MNSRHFTLSHFFLIAYASAQTVALTETEGRKVVEVAIKEQNSRSRQRVALGDFAPEMAGLALPQRVKFFVTNWPVPTQPIVSFGPNPLTEVEQCSRDSNSLTYAFKEYQLRLNRQSGSLTGIYSTSPQDAHEREIVYTPSDAARLMEPWRRFAELGDAESDFRINSAYIVPSLPWELQVSYAEFLPGTDCETGRSIGGILSLLNGMPIHITVSRGDFARESLFAFPLTREQVFTRVLNVATSRLDWPVYRIVTNNARYRVGPFSSGRLEFSERHAQLVRERRAFLVYSSLVGWPDEGVPGGWRGTAEVFTDALTGEVIAFQPLPLPGGTVPNPVPLRLKPEDPVADPSGRYSSALATTSLGLGSRSVDVMVRQGSDVFRAKLSLTQPMIEVAGTSYRISSELASRLRYKR